jgi:peptidoglycan-associated lipoprotein
MSIAAAVLVIVAIAACAKKPPAVARPMPPPADGATSIPPTPPAPPRPVDEPIPVPPEPDSIRAGDLTDDLDTLNRAGLLKPLLFDLDSSDVSPAGQQVLQENADIMRKYPQMQVTIEGHCDERGTAEYNLALGERRATAVRSYMRNLGIDQNRMKTRSMGENQPLCNDSSEECYSRNRRVNFVQQRGQM